MGVLLVAIALASLYIQLWLFVVLIVVAIFLGTDELATALRDQGHPPVQAPAADRGAC